MFLKTFSANIVENGIFRILIVNCSFDRIWNEIRNI